MYRIHLYHIFERLAGRMDKRHEANRIVKEKICSATIRLMGKKPFSAITVTDIVREAGVARVSYYRNFSCKQDVIRAHLAEVVERLVQHQKLQKSAGTYETILQCWKYFAEQKETLAAFCSGELSELLLDFLARINLHSGDSAGKAEENYYFTAYIGALYNTLRKWLSGGCRETPEEMAGIFYRIWSSSQIAQA